MRIPAALNNGIRLLVGISFWMGIGLMLLGQLISFYPGAEVRYFAWAAGLVACGLVLPGRKRRTAAVFGCALCIAFALAGHRRGVEYVQWQRNRWQRAAHESSKERLLDFYDARYDGNSGMLRVSFDSPGYHSTLADGTDVHPTRESLFYALALLQRNASGDVLRARTILETVIALQDMNANSPTFGCWPWFLEEPLARMSPPDFNWAGFCAAQIVQALHKHGNLLPPALRDEMRKSLRRATASIRKRNIGPAYTNVAVLEGGVCAAVGEILDDPELLEFGRRRLQSVVAHVARHDGFTEYNSPPYTKVVIAECERTLQLVHDAQTRKAAESLRRSAWRIASESFHPPTQQWAGPHSRTSRERLRKSTTDFLSVRIGHAIKPHPAMIAGDEPRGYAVVDPLPCPTEFVEGFRSQGKIPSQIQRTFIRSRRVSHSIIGTTWFGPDSCLASVNRSSFWTQRKPLIGYWQTEHDPAVVFRVRFLHDGKDFASMGVRSSQQGPRVLSLVHSVTDRGDWHRTRDRPTNGRFPMRDLRIRCALSGIGASVVSLESGRFALSAGGQRIILHPLPSQFAEHAVRWQSGHDGKTVFVDGICYAGPLRTFDFNHPLAMRLAIGIELQKLTDAITGSSPVWENTDSHNLRARWKVNSKSTLAVEFAPQ